ncbi:MAG: alpha/beta fold hydrolase [Chthoniobacterales bacterium]
MPSTTPLLTRFLNSFASKYPGRRMAAFGIAIVCAMHVTGCATPPRQKPIDARAAQANQMLQHADRKRAQDPAQAMGVYLSVAEKSLALTTDKTESAAVRTQAERIYNTAVTDCALTLQKLKPTSAHGSYWTFSDGHTTYKLRIASSGGTGVENPARFDRLMNSRDVKRKHLNSDTERAGIGGTLLGIQDSAKTNVPHRPPNGFAEPLTAVIAFGKPSHGGDTAELSFYDPRVRDHVTLNNKTYPLKGDFTAPLAFFPKPRGIFGIVAMLRSDRVVNKAGLYFCEPYNPNKIPVLFVHGLMSSPHTWINFINELNNDPEFRRHYQSWLFLYPSGAPIGGTAMKLREDLATAATHYPLKHNLIIVGHSMGGILTRMQVTDTSNRQLWNGVFGKASDQFYAVFPSNSLIKKALIFKANPYVTRVIYISTPHQGSDLATLRISQLGSMLIRLPAKLIKALDPQTKQALKSVSPQLRTAPNSILSLSPKSPLLKTLSNLPMTVPCHSIIGNRGKDNEPLAKTSDGVVPYWSSHVAAAKSEIIVPTGHDAFNNPRSVKEVLRILKLKP